MSRPTTILSRLFVGLVVFSLFSAGLPLSHNPINASSIDSEWTAAVADDAFVFYEENGEVHCRPATAEEARAIFQRDEQLPMQVLTPEGLSAQEVSNLNIVLRGTPQLNNFPQARDGFLRAAETWKSRIQTQTAITIIIDVDFGPTRFGQTFPSGVLGSTGSQSLGNSNGYAGLRSSLLQRTSSAGESSLYNTLPGTAVPTDLGETSAFVVPSPVLRSLGLINAVAEPDAERAQFGPPPSIGFNSNFAFDFEPNDGIDIDKTDFDAVAVHEIGHLLGFTSRVGAKELSPQEAVSLSLLDIFRFRPGVNLGTFTTASRVLSSGGDQIFFSGLEGLPLSTGRPNGSGGDGNQSSHWKDNTFLGFNVGIMDPRIARGERGVITDNDLQAYDAFGYSIRTDTGGNDAPSILNISGSLQGDTLTLSGSALDQQADITQAEVSLLDSSGNPLSQNPPVDINSGGSSTLNFSIQLNGLNNLPAATKARVVFVDGQGNRSIGAFADFSLADAGGPDIKKVSHNGSKLVIKGGSLNGQLQIEVNGVIVATKNNAAIGKTKIGGALSSLNIRNGPNRVRVIKGGLRSNISILTL